jgi:hypothetical protein
MPIFDAEGFSNCNAANGRRSAERRLVPSRFYFMLALTYVTYRY